MAVHLIRHTRPEVASSLCYGRTDLALSEDGVRAIPDVVGALGGVSCVVSSPLSRCVALANAFVATEHEVTHSSHWIEMDFGLWEAVPWGAIPRAELDAWAADFMGYRGHGGESVADLRDRVARGLKALPDDAVVVTHAGVIKAACAILNQRDGWETRPAFGEIVTLTR